MKITLSDNGYGSELGYAALTMIQCVCILNPWFLPAAITNRPRDPYRKMKSVQSGIFFPPHYGGETGFRELFPPHYPGPRGGNRSYFPPIIWDPGGEIKKFPLHFLARWGGSARRRRKIWRIGALKCSISLRKMLSSDLESIKFSACGGLFRRVIICFCLLFWYARS